MPEPVPVPMPLPEVDSDSRPGLSTPSLATFAVVLGGFVLMMMMLDAPRSISVRLVPGRAVSNAASAKQALA